MLARPYENVGAGLESTPIEIDLGIMKLSMIQQQQAIEARMALIVRRRRIRSAVPRLPMRTELEGDILFVDAFDEERSSEIEERFTLHISIIAAIF